MVELCRTGSNQATAGVRQAQQVSDLERVGFQLQLQHFAIQIYLHCYMITVSTVIPCFPRT